MGAVSPPPPQGKLLPPIGEGRQTMVVGGITLGAIDVLLVLLDRNTLCSSSLDWSLSPNDDKGPPLLDDCEASVLLDTSASGVSVTSSSSFT